MVILGDGSEQYPHRRCIRQVEREGQHLLDPPDGGRFAVVLGKIAKIDLLQWDWARWEDDLSRLPVVLREDRPQRFMPGRYRRERAFDAGDVHGASDSDGGGNVVGRHRRHQLLQVPQICLHWCQRQRRGSVGRSGSAHRGLIGG